MIKSQTDIVTQSEGVEKEAFFRISQNNISHILGILRNSMYSDKVLAVCREYMANAYDAHVALGKEDQPIEVALPTSLYPYFTVRDFGPGLNEEEVFGLFTSYGESTKRESNDYVGMLGIGSKAAFAYTDSFNVVSYQNGAKRTYTCYIDESEIGKVALLSEEQCEEQSTGLEINVPVKGTDFKSFELKAYEASLFFKTPPLINGEARSRVKTPKFAIDFLPMLADPSSNFFAVLPDDRAYRHHRDFSVIMGNIAYKIPLMTLREIDPEFYTVFFDGYRAELNYATFCMRVPIGSVDIAASRETLSLSKRTVSFLREEMQRILSWLTESIQEFVESQRSEFQAMALFTRISWAGLGRLFASQHNKKLPQLKWRGKVIGDGWKPSLKEVFLKVRTSTRSGNMRIVRSPVYNNFAHYLGVLINDTGTTLNRARINKLLSDPQRPAGDWLYVSDPKDLEELKKAFDGCYYLLSEVVLDEGEIKKERAKYAPRFSPKLSLFEFDPDAAKPDLWKPAENMEEVEGGYYVVIHRFLPLILGRDVWTSSKWLLGAPYPATDRTQILRLMEIAKYLGLPVDKLYAVRKSKVEEMEGDENWIELFSELKKVTEAQYQDHPSYPALCSIVHHQVAFESYRYDGINEVQDTLLASKSKSLRAQGEYIKSVDQEWISNMGALVKLFGLKTDQAIGAKCFHWPNPFLDRLGLKQNSWYFITNLEMMDTMLVWHERVQDLENQVQELSKLAFANLEHNERITNEECPLHTNH